MKHLLGSKARIQHDLGAKSAIQVGGKVAVWPAMYLNCQPGFHIFRSWSQPVPQQVVFKEPAELSCKAKAPKILLRLDLFGKS